MSPADRLQQAGAGAIIGGMCASTTLREAGK
jgi:hypothetical protein